MLLIFYILICENGISVLYVSLIVSAHNVSYSLVLDVLLYCVYICMYVDCASTCTLEITRSFLGLWNPPPYPQL